MYQGKVKNKKRGVSLAHNVMCTVLFLLFLRTKTIVNRFSTCVCVSMCVFVSQLTCLVNEN